MSKYRELDLLREQENTLLQLHMKFNDQLNRLKVEELALTNLLRLQKEREMQAQTGTTDRVGPSEKAIEEETMQVLNLLVDPGPQEAEEEEEEEEDEENDDEGETSQADQRDSANLEDSYNDQLATYLEDLYQQQQEKNQMAEMEQEEKELQQQLHLITRQGVKEEEDDDDDDEVEET